jgi:outer membrane protein TolC
VTWGLESRADLKEAAARLASLAQLRQSAERKLNKSQAAIFAASERQALARVAALKQSARLDIATAWLGWQAAQKQSLTMDNVASRAEKISQQSDLSITAGTISLLEALAARADARQAQASAHRVALNLIAKRLDLARQLGILSSPTSTLSPTLLPVLRN